MNNLRLIDILMEVRRRRRMSYPTNSGTSSQPVARSGPRARGRFFKFVRSPFWIAHRTPYCLFSPSIPSHPVLPFAVRIYADGGPDWYQIPSRANELFNEYSNRMYSLRKKNWPIVGTTGIGQLQRSLRAHTTNVLFLAPYTVKKLC